MSNSIVANRYAQALFELAQEKQVLAEVSADLAELTKVIKGNPELLALLISPKLSEERKKQVVAEIFANANQIVINILEILIEKKRVNEAIYLAESFSALAADVQGAAEATVYSTRELTAEERESISTTFAKRVGKQTLTITNEVDPSLVGGIRIQIGNHIFDNSVASKLNRLKRELIG